MSRMMRSTVALVSSTVITAVLGMAFWTVAARVFDAGEMGRASAGSSAMLLLGALGQLALVSVFARVMPAMSTGLGRFAAGCYTLMTVATVAVTAGFVVTGLGDGFLVHTPVAEISFALAVVATAMSAVHDGALVALGHSTWVPIKNTVLAIARMALLPVFGATHLPSPILVAWALPTVVAVAVLNIILFGRVIPGRAGAVPQGTVAPSRRTLVRLIGGQYAGSVVNALVLFFPPVLVALVLGPHANAVFFLPWTIATGVMALLWNVVVPFIVEASADPARVGTHLRLAVLGGGLLTLAGAVGLLLLAPQLLRLAGDSYSAEGATALRLLAIALPFAALGSFFNAVELIELKSRISLLTKVLAAVVFLGGAVPAMHAYGIAGAAAAFLAAQAIVGLALLGPLVSRHRALVRTAVS